MVDERAGRVRPIAQDDLTRERTPTEEDMESSGAGLHQLADVGDDAPRLGPTNHLLPIGRLILPPTSNANPHHDAPRSMLRRCW
jgi:hypothetical protein